MSNAKKYSKNNKQINRIETSNVSEEEKNEQKFNIGDKVIVNGAVYCEPNKDGVVMHLNKQVTYITKYIKNAKHPYNVTDNLGWINEESITIYNYGISHIVKEGETLEDISAKYDLEWQKIYARNKFVIGNNPKNIQKGQILVIKD